MLDREKVIMMTRMASYEKGKGKDHLRIGSSFRADYIFASILKAIFAITVAFVCGVALYIYYNLEQFMENIYDLDLVAILKGFGKYYLIVMIIYVAICYIVAFIRYAVATGSIRKYKSNLKKLRKMQKDQ